MYVEKTNRHLWVQRAEGHQESGQKKSGVELLSHTQLCSIIAAGPLNNRVRDGNVCFKTAINTGIKISKVAGIREDVSKTWKKSQVFHREN